MTLEPDSKQSIDKYSYVSLSRLLYNKAGGELLPGKFGTNNGRINVQFADVMHPQQHQQGDFPQHESPLQ